MTTPTLGGVAQVGQTLTIADGAFSNGPTAMSYSFFRLTGGVLTLVQTAGAAGATSSAGPTTAARSSDA